MPTLAALQAVTETATLDFYGQSIKVKYRPGALTIKVERLLFGDVGDEDGDRRRDQVLEAFLAIIDSWDITEPDGKTKLAVTKENLAEVPREVLYEVLRKIGEASARGKNGGSGASTPS
jgi:hypothetical protein